MQKSSLFLVIAGLLVVNAPSVGVAAASTTSAVPLDTRVERLERRISRLTDLMLQMEQLKRENSELRGQIELQKHAIDALKQRQRDLYIDIDQRLSQMQQAPAASSPAIPATPAQAATTSTAVTTPVVTAKPVTQAGTATSQEEADYKAAFALLSPSQRRYAEAITALTAFLQKYPSSRLADNAQYWLAEANYVSQKNDVALVEFQKVVDLYPQSPKVSGALLKIGYLQQAAGKISEAEKTLQSVVKRFANSSAANMAEKRLQRIKQKNR